MVLAMVMTVELIIGGNMLETLGSTRHKSIQRLKRTLLGRDLPFLFEASKCVMIKLINNMFTNVQRLFPFWTEN